ncbi:hypothetical protein L9F63_001134, partial [Diploptera punctata]
DSNKCSVDTLCRTCARVCEDLIPVFSDKGLEMQLVEKIHTHLPIMVTREDVLPLAICLSCVEKLETCNEFVHCSLQADAMLRSILSLQTALERCKKEIEDEENKKPADIEIKEQQSSSNELKKKQDVIEPVENEINSDKCITTVEQYGTESKINSINPKFKVVVMKMKNAKNLSSDAQMEKALNMLKNLDSAPVSCTLSEQIEEHHRIDEPPQETELSGLETSDIEIPDDLTACLLNESSSTSLPVLSNEDTKSIDIKPLPSVICEDTISSSFVEINKKSSRTSIEQIDDLLYTCIHCKKTISGKEQFVMHKKINHPDIVFCCPDCDGVIFESKEIFEEHIKIHLNEPECIGISDINWRHTELGRKDELPSIDVGLISRDTEYEMQKSSFNPHIETELYSKLVPIRQEEGALEIVSVADVHIESEKEFQEESKLQGNSKFRMKISKDFEKIENKLKSKIIGAIKGIIKTSENGKSSKIEEVPNGTKEKSQNSKHWTCRKCEHISFSWGEHIQHLQSHPLKSFQCTYCDKTFNSKSKLDYHTCTHTQEKKLICEYCGKSFRNNQNLKNHLHVHGATDTIYECKECNKKFATKGGYESHCYTHAEALYLCEVCGKSMKHFSSLRLHRLSHFDPTFFSRYRCLVCGRTCQNRYLLKEHMNVHTNVRPYKCSHCVKSFHKRCQLRQHVVIHLNTRQHKCPVCGKGFNRLGNMKAHARRHLNSNCYTCKLCKTTFSSFSEIIQHRKSHKHKDPEQSMKQQAHQNENVCNICGKRLSSKLTLKYHVILHSDNKPFSCEVCAKKFPHKRKLYLHRKIHSSEKAFPCHFCNEGFRTKQLQIIHERIHTGEKPFQCINCNKAFRSRMTLKQHMLVHSDIRPFRCVQCNKSFRRRDTLDAHMRTHTGERPYTCHLCSRSFKQKGDCNKHLKTHFKSHTDVQDILTTISFSCILCGQNFNQKDDLDIHFETFHTTDIIVASNTLMINSDTLVALPGIMEDDQKSVILSNLGTCLETV